MRILIFFFLFVLFSTNVLSAQQFADCDKAMDICKKKKYVIDRTGGEGENPSEADLISCFMNGDNYGQAEENCTWIKFEIAQSGTLSFTITPEAADNDIDFVVFRLPTNGDCAYKQIVRCMAAGDSRENVGHSNCLGQTGLRDGEKDSSEDAGCSDEGDNTWLAPLRTVKGEKYVLLVSNVTEAGPGFSISFGGTAKLPCDEDPPKIAEKPKEKPKIRETPPPTIRAAPTETPKAKAPIPNSIEGRKVKFTQEIKVKSKILKIKLWDSQVEDGDVISLYLNERKIKDRLYLRLKPHAYDFEIDLGDYKESFLTIVANEFGKAPINSAAIEIDDGFSVQKFDLAADFAKNETVKIVVE